MKRTVALVIALVMAFTLTACAGLAQKAVDAENATPVPSPTPDLTGILSASASDAATAAQTHVPPASSSNAQTAAEQQPAAEQPSGQQGYETARGYIGLSVQDLYAAVGQPTGTPTYGPSCLQEGAEDGMLPYDGFSVWTIRTATEELVHEVYLSE